MAASARDVTWSARCCSLAAGAQLAASTRASLAGCSATGLAASARLPESGPVPREPPAFGCDSSMRSPCERATPRGAPGALCAHCCHAVSTRSTHGAHASLSLPPFTLLHILPGTPLSTPRAPLLPPASADRASAGRASAGHASAGHASAALSTRAATARYLAGRSPAVREQLEPPGRRQAVFAGLAARRAIAACTAAVQATHMSPAALST